MNLKDLNEKDYEKLKAQVGAVIRKLNVPGIDVEDTTQSILLTWLTRRQEAPSRIDWAVIDYIRDQYGRVGSDHQLTRRNIATAIPASALGDEDDSRGPEEMLDRYSGLLEIPEQDELDLEKISRLKPKLQRVLELYLDGITLVKIGKEFGVTESRVSQWMSEIRKTLVEQEVVEEIMGLKNLSPEARMFLKRVRG